MSEILLTERQIGLFWQKVNKDSPAPPHMPELGPCWIWTGQTMTPRGTPNDYGRIRMKGKMYKSHRVSYILANGQIAGGLCVLHKCDTPRCVNPAHLFLGTRAANIADMNAKGRRRGGDPAKTWSRVHPERVLRGSANPKSKLTEADVVAMRLEYAAGGVSQQAIADRHGVSQHLISAIIRRKTWRHVAQ